MDDSELNAIRQARLAELQSAKAQTPQSASLSTILDNNARERLSRVRIVRPDRADAVEQYIMKLISMNAISRKLNEQDVVDILQNLSKDEKSATKIIFDRKNNDDDDDDFFD